jgi:hypothetical protein
VASNAPFLAECGITGLPGVESGMAGRDRMQERCAVVDVGIGSAAKARLVSLLPPAHISVAPLERMLTGLDELFTLLPWSAEEARLRPNTLPTEFWRGAPFGHTPCRQPGCPFSSTGTRVLSRKNHKQLKNIGLLEPA